MNSEQKTQAAFELLMQDNNEAIIFGVLKKLHISPLHPCYDDFAQEGRLKFVEAYLHYGDNVAADPHKFFVFAYTRIWWRILDLLKQQNFQNTQHEFSLDNDLIPEDITNKLLIDPDTATDPLQQLLSDDFFRKLFIVCTSQERQYLIGAVLKQQTGGEIARSYGVSRQAVAKWRGSVTKKAIELNR